MSFMKRKLPIGIQSFAKLREGGFVYVDKSRQIYNLVDNAAGPVFLSRPRRFGKSLLCSTLKALFEGRRDLFKGLAIDSLDWEWKSYPVIHLDLNAADYTQGLNKLNALLSSMLGTAAKSAGLSVCSDTPPEIQFRELISEMHKKTELPVAVIIDEYDKPLLSTIDNRELHEQMRNALKGFYGVFKSSDEYLEFVFLTGVTKFSKVSIFSDLNNLTDISLNPKYSDICGITQNELEQCFYEEITLIAQEKNTKPETYIDDLKRFYNGYRFSSNPITVYNPFGLLQHFGNDGKFSSYWFATGTPTFLLKLIEAQHIDILNLEKETVTLDDFHKFDAENMDAVPVLYQSGYLTISDYNKDTEEFALDYPNIEVRSAFSRSLLGYFTNIPDSKTRATVNKIPSALRNGDIDAAMNALKSFLASVPYNIQIKQEKYYQTIVHLIFRMLGFDCRSEVQIADGRIDTLVETIDKVFCFEFKLNGSAQDALQQIDSKEYLLPWSGSGKKLFKVGVSFDFEKRNILEWKVSS
ncbi:ATPase AAA [Spirochaetia bacterium]|nr:ATPase AAA [Spirochaetia bacterium]